MHGQRISYLTGRLKNVVSRRADEARRTVKLLRYDVVQPGAEIKRCFAQPSIYRLAVHLKDEQYVLNWIELNWSLFVYTETSFEQLLYIACTATGLCRLRDSSPSFCSAGAQKRASIVFSMLFARQQRHTKTTAAQFLHSSCTKILSGWVR